MAGIASGDCQAENIIERWQRGCYRRRSGSLHCSDECPMNNINPTEVVQLWQEKLSDARRELADFEQRVGELALVNDAIELAQRLTLLRDAVTIAEAALVTAQRKAPDPRVT